MENDGKMLYRCMQSGRLVSIEDDDRFPCCKYPLWSSDIHQPVCTLAEYLGVERGPGPGDVGMIRYLVHKYQPIARPMTSLHHDVVSCELLWLITVAEDWLRMKGKR